jgi:transposase
LQEIQEIPAKNLVYMDESGLDEDLQRMYGRALRGEGVQGIHTGGRVRRISMIAAFCQKQLQAPMRFEGYCDSSVVNAWIQQCLLPTLIPGQVVIFDNASFHKSKKTKELIESKGCTIKFLPPYSPDYNPIENAWSILKNRIKKIRRHYTSIEHCIDRALCVPI